MKYRHKKRGSVYEIMGHGKLQAADNPLDGIDLVFYRSVDTGDLWARPTAEFHDGRFEPVSEDFLDSKLGSE